MGYPSHRAGWYTPHWLDRLTFGIKHRNADRIVAELQKLAAGDRVPDSDDWSAFFTVEAVDPPHALVLHSTRHVIRPIETIDFTWAFVIRELAPETSRLLIRARTNYTPRRAMPFVELVIAPPTSSMPARCCGESRSGSKPRRIVPSQRTTTDPSHPGESTMMWITARVAGEWVTGSREPEPASSRRRRSAARLRPCRAGRAGRCRSRGIRGSPEDARRRSLARRRRPPPAARLQLDPTKKGPHLLEGEPAEGRHRGRARLGRGAAPATCPCGRT
jgi:hypothetical protein